MLTVHGRGATLCDGLDRREALCVGGLSLFAGNHAPALLALPMGPCSVHYTSEAGPSTLSKRSLDGLDQVAGPIGLGQKGAGAGVEELLHLVLQGVAAGEDHPEVWGELT